MTSRNQHMTISPERLAALRWGEDDPRVGVLSIGRRITAWRNRRGLFVAHDGDTILHVEPSRLVITARPNMSKPHFYQVIGSTCRHLDLADVALSTKNDRLMGNVNGILHLANGKGELVVQL